VPQPAGKPLVGTLDIQVVIVLPYQLRLTYGMGGRVEFFEN
jgi:hypothetical protein